MTTERIDEIATQARELAQHEAGRLFDWLAHDVLIPLCESPIEKMFALAIIPKMIAHRAVSVQPQERVGNHRVDFRVGLRTTHGPIRIAVECDGHEFHERTKEQAARDKRRDRALIAEGYRVMRFTGSELFADPHACAEEVIEALYRERERNTPTRGE
jgi:very-short-patch-repair endonuclease